MAPFRLSASYNELYELGCRPSHNYSSATTTFFDSPATALSTPTSVAALYTQLAFAERQIFILDAENALLREKNENLWLIVKVLLVEIEIMQVVFGKDIHSARNVVSLLQGKLTDYHEFNGVLTQGYPRRTINSAHISAEKKVRDVEATLVENATHEHDSSWSKVLQILINHHDSESFVAATDMAYKLCRIPHEKEKAVRFADSQTTPKPNGTTGFVARLPLAASGCRDIDNNLSRCQDIFLSNSGDSLQLEELQVNNTFTCSRSHPSSIHTVSISHKNQDKWTSRLEGRDDCSLRRSHCPFETNCSRRFTFPNSVDIDVRTVDKRHGFLMPCIKPVLQKHAFTPVAPLTSDPARQGNEDPSMFPVPSLSNSSRSSVPSTIGSLSLNHRDVSLSAERLCATFSSGSLGSLELTVSSGSNHSFSANFLSNDPRAPGKSSNVKGKDISCCSTMVGNNKRDSHALFEKEINNSCISSQVPQSDANYLPLQMPPVTGKPIPKLALRLPSIESQFLSSHPSTNQVSRRSARPGHDPIAVDPLTLKTGITSKKENKLGVVSWNTKVADCSNQFLRFRTPATTNNTLRPKLNIIKCGLAKPVEPVRPVSRTNIPVPVSRTRTVHKAGFTSSPVPSPRVSQCKPIEISACQENIPISKPCSRLRVVNVTNTERGQHQRAGINCYGRIRSDVTWVEPPQFETQRSSVKFKNQSPEKP